VVLVMHVDEFAFELKVGGIWGIIPIEGGIVQPTKATCHSI
jgi:hypothetical protein